MIISTVYRCFTEFRYRNPLLRKAVCSYLIEIKVIIVKMCVSLSNNLILFSIFSLHSEYNSQVEEAMCSLDPLFTH